MFDRIADLHWAKSYFDSDLLNIEEILSIIEMDDSLQGRSLSRDIQRYIRDVIQACTPPMRRPAPGSPHAWNDVIFGRNPWRPYGSFVLGLLGLAVKLTTTRSGKGISVKESPFETSYGIVSVNYDLVMEEQIGFIGSYAGLASRRPSSSGVEGGLPLAKLHGSVDSGNIVPPTWNKTLRTEIEGEWKLAYELIAKANHIRFIGYSLPTTDAYVRYLLKAAIVHCENLKSIDVICMDPEGSVRERYRSFVNFNFFRFKNASTERYLGHVAEKYKELSDRSVYIDLETNHEHFMNS